MLKLGVTRVADVGARTRLLGRERHVSFLLLPALAATAQGDTAYDEVIARVLLPNGTWKQTSAGRLRLVDDAVVRVLAMRRPAGGPLSVLDLAASTGVTSAELWDALAPAFRVDVTATDLYRDLFAVEPLHGRWAIVFDASGAVLQHVVGPFVLPGQLGESAAYPVNRALKVWSERRLVPRARAVLAAVGERALPDFGALGIDGHRVRRLPLVAKRCLELMRAGASFRFEVGDILRPTGRRADLVRAMNIITRDNFDDAQARRAIGHCVAAVNPGGLLVLGQSRGLDPEQVRATIYSVENGVATVAERVKEGFELEPLVGEVAGAATAGAEIRSA